MNKVQCATLHHSTICFFPQENSSRTNWREAVRRQLSVIVLFFILFFVFFSLYLSENFALVVSTLSRLPPATHHLFDFLLDFIAEVSFYSDKNRMNTINLATVFAPNLLRPKVEPEAHSFLPPLLLVFSLLEDIPSFDSFERRTAA